MRLPRLSIALCLIVAVGFIADGCGSDPGAGPAGGGPFSWSLRVADAAGRLTNCTNYIDTANPPGNIKGGTVSTEPCPTTAEIVGVCAGKDRGGNQYQQVFYNPTGAPGSPSLLALQCSTIGGTFSSTYVPAWNGANGATGTGGTTGNNAGTGGVSGGGTGGTAGTTGSCAQLSACCKAASAQLKTACMAAYDATVPSDAACGYAYTGLHATYCPNT